MAAQQEKGWPEWLVSQIEADPVIQRQLRADRMTPEQCRAALRSLAGVATGPAWKQALAAAGLAPSSGEKTG